MSKARSAAGSRCTKAAQQSAFWKSDPHRLAVYNQFMNGTTPFEFTKNYKFTVLNNENVWAKADEPRAQREGAGRQGGRRDDRPHQGCGELTTHPRRPGGRLPLEGAPPAARRSRFRGRLLGEPNPIDVNTAAISAPPAPQAAPTVWELWGRLLVVPYLLVFVVFVLYPVGYGLWLARDPQSYVKLFDDPIFFRTAINTLVFLVVAVNLKMVVALALSGFFVQTRWWIKCCRRSSSCPGRCRRSRPSCRCASCSTPSGG